MDNVRAPDHPLRAQAGADLARVIQEIIRLTGRQTSWNGVALVREPDFAFSGEKHRWCGISLREDVLTIPEQRWTTMIHEGMHSVSAAFSVSRLDPTQGRWEEGTAEQLQGLLRDRLLATLGVKLDTMYVRELDAKHRYNEHIRALEVYRAAARTSPANFYLALLKSVPIERSRLLIGVMRTRIEGQAEDR